MVTEAEFNLEAKDLAERAEARFQKMLEEVKANGPVKVVTVNWGLPNECS